MNDDNIKNQKSCDFAITQERDRSVLEKHEKEMICGGKA